MDNASSTKRRPLSLAARAALATGFALAAFLGLTGLAQNKANYASELSAMHDRLHNYAIAYITGTDTTRAGKVTTPDSQPNPDFSRPGSGLYAIIVGNDGFRWESSSALGRDFDFVRMLSPGETAFEPVETRSGKLYVFSYGVSLDTTDKRSVPLTFAVAQTEDQFERQVATYRRTQFLWLAMLGMMLMLLQLFLLRWSLLPLRRVSSDLAHIERGTRDHLDGPYPVELTVLTRRLNAFIDSEREQRSRYRDTLADLAHSLKTPLAVVRSQLETDGDAPSLRGDILDQVRKMDEIVAYQLSRAATSGRRTIAAEEPIAGHAEDLVQSLEKVYAAKNVLCEFEIDDGAAFAGEQGDLLELMGNLVENAFKWASHRVLLTARSSSGKGKGRRGLELIVEDDGPGIADDKIEKILQRGVRGDERVQGHGIGLSIVQDIVKAYQGELHVDRSEELGGARFSVRLPPG
ncbi:two-component system sensor histidine kinase PhoQ [Luteibacter sp. OK325]|jgi:two-component system sensor histidine kinase PhoQ|uniref:ATP-binding protein n=1 Tax=Luteibacter sp. OK325 TaxID=2135670 RepID=UPI000D3D8553|nr:ATP-binding protein [Luteibacter sp. OK325]PTR33508.1 two-component system sensor histidine kinase PhoQ [Luteibacter sp. OK325]